MFKLITGFFLIIISTIIIYETLNIKDVYAVTPGVCSGGTIARSDGLVSTVQDTSGSKFKTTGPCVVDTNAIFSDSEIKKYADLKSIFFTESKISSPPVFDKKSVTGNVNQSQLSLSSSLDNLRLVRGDLTIFGSFNTNRTAVFFIDGNLNIQSNISYPGNNGVDPNSLGLVFIVNGDVNISSTVTAINAAIISYGTICTAGDGTTCQTGSKISAQTLNVYGNLISLNKSKPIQFMRTNLRNDTTPAEKVTLQPKYFVVLRHIFSDSLTISIPDIQY